MRLDRILIDIIDSWRRWLFGKHNKTENPYEVVENQRTARGRLLRVKRDTHRAVDGWIFTPFAPPSGMTKIGKNLMDICIFLDHQEPENGWRYRDSDFFISHRITIFQASHFLSSQQNFDSDAIFQGDYNCLRPSIPSKRDTWAIAICSDLARTLSTQPHSRINWVQEIEIARKYYLGGDYVPSRYVA